MYDNTLTIKNLGRLLPCLYVIGHANLTVKGYYELSNSLDMSVKYTPVELVNTLLSRFPLWADIDTKCNTFLEI